MTDIQYVSTYGATPSAASSPKAAPIASAAPAAGAAGLVAVGTPNVPSGAATLTVGVGKQFATLAAAIAASRDGTAILVDAGTYTNDFATITAKISIIGVGGMVRLVATVPPPNFKGILTVDNDVTIRNVSFSGCAIPDEQGGNGAGIRYEGGVMTLTNCEFRNNQNGILANAVIPQLSVNTIAIDHCLFSGNGSGTGYTHNLYVGGVDKLVATNSIFEGAKVGHEFKSRALVNQIEGNVFRDGPAGTASYDIDLPNGGTAVIRNNSIEKGPNAENNAMVHFGGEGIPYAGSSLLVEGNVFINDKGGSTVAVLNQTAISVAINDNEFRDIASSQIARGPAGGTGNTDGAGQTLPDINLVGALPGNTLVFTDNDPHSVVLTGTLMAVQGGGGRLTVSAISGHVIAIGGAGGMDFTGIAPSGGNSVSTKAGSVNTIRLSGQDLIDSQGTDRIYGGGGNITGAIAGTAIVDDGTGSDTWSVTGTARIIGHGGNPVVTVGPAGKLTVSGPLGYLAVQNNGGTASIDIVQGGARQALSIVGGAVYLRVYDAAMHITTAAGAQGTVLRLGPGATDVSSLGADVIWAGSGAATIIVSGRAEVHAGTGALSLFGRGSPGAKFYGNGGTYLLDGDTGNITYYGGDRASTVTLRLSSNTLVGGAGLLTIVGGARETIIGGSGGVRFTEREGDGANTIGTAAGSRNTLILSGADVVTSRGEDTIFGGVGNQSMTILGNSVVTGSTGASYLTFSGRDTLIGRGQDICTVTAGADLTVRAGRYTLVNETGAVVRFSTAAGANAASLVASGGGASILGGLDIPLSVTTAAGLVTQLTLGRGTIDVHTYGGDFIHTGAGAYTIALGAADTHVWGGSGNLVVHNRDWIAGDKQIIHGGGGRVVYDQAVGALRFFGGSGSATLDGGAGSLSVTAGSGDFTITGGSAGMKFVGGSGHADIAVTPGGGDITFGSGATEVRVAGWGQAELFRCLAGSGGGLADITGFRPGIDRIILDAGVSVASRQVSGGTTHLVLSDETKLNLIGLSDPSRIF